MSERKPNSNRLPFFCFICAEYFEDLEKHRHSEKEREEWRSSGYKKHFPPPKGEEK